MKLVNVTMQLEMAFDFERRFEGLVKRTPLLQTKYKMLSPHTYFHPL